LIQIVNYGGWVIRITKENIVNTKTWKIGERCRGGVITVTVRGKEVIVEGKDWDSSGGSSTEASQKNARVWTDDTFDFGVDGQESYCLVFLEDLATYYHATKIIDWIKSKVN